MPPKNDSKSSMDGVKPPKPPIPPVSRRSPEYRYDHELPAPEPVERIAAQAASDLPSISPAAQVKTGMPWRRKLLIGLIFVVVLIGVLLASACIWYQQQLRPLSDNTSTRVRVTIASGSTPSAIAQQLKDAGVIRSDVAFSIYAKLTGTENKLKAGAYNLQPSISTPAIVDHLVSGKQDTFRITFLPGDTLTNNRKKLIEVGYTEAEVDAALSKSYSRPLFAGKPSSADLEGYIFGETYEFDASVSVEMILQRTFDEYEAVIKESDLIVGFQRQGLNLYQGITLASIVQRESHGDPEDQRQIAAVFLNRIKAGMTLGSDVTYQYIADKTGVTRDVNLDSPYNTRRYTGLPPGPIASPSVGSLKGVANPANNNYLFFLSGDDNITYFARTDAEHQQNIVQHCQKKCQII